LIRELISQEMTPEERAQVELGEMEARVEQRLAELQTKLAQLTGGELRPGAGDPITGRVLAAVGRRVLAFDPKTNLHPEVRKEVCVADEAGRGYLRSARSERIDGEDWLLVGGRRGDYRLSGRHRND